MAVNINVPSQVKTYANLAAFPASGALKTIYIAEDTNKTYRWTGSVYVEVSAAGASGITIGTTAIASGTVGRVLFQGTGNVLQQSSSLFWDNTNARLELTTADNVFATFLKASTGQLKIKPYLNPTFGVLMESRNAADSAYLPFTISGSKIQLADGNVLINTTTDAGFKLDVNGTARVQGNTTVSLNQNGATELNVSNTNNSAASQTLIRISSSSGSGLIGRYSASTTPYKTLLANDTFFYSAGTSDISFLNDFATGKIKWATGGVSTPQMTLFATGNLGINTTTDAGFRLDVNGTARVDQTLRLNGTGNGELINFGGNVGRFMIDGSWIRFKASNGGDIMNINANFLGILETAVIPSAVMAIGSTTRGFLPPRMTTTQKNAIATPATGLQIYDSTLNRPCFYDGTTWITL